MTKSTTPYQDQNSSLTAKGDPRQFVKHCYTDHSNVPGDINFAQRFCLVTYDGEGEPGIPSEQKHVTQMIQTPTFPLKLHMILEKIEESDSSMKNAISWLPHGRAFHIRNVDIFKREVLPKYFKSCKLSSFYRQINLYGFVRLTTGCETGAYYHEHFLRGRAFLTKNIIRTKVKGTKIRPTSAPEDEPNFYAMTPVSTRLIGSGGMGVGMGGMQSEENPIAMLAAMQEKVQQQQQQQQTEQMNFANGHFGGGIQGGIQGGMQSGIQGGMHYNIQQNSRQSLLLEQIASLQAQQESMNRLQPSVSLFNRGYLADNQPLPYNKMQTSVNHEMSRLSRNALVQNELSRSTTQNEILQAAMRNALSRNIHNEIPRMADHNETQLIQPSAINSTFPTPNLFEAVLSGRSGNDANFDVENR